MNENLRESLDTALMFEKLITTFRSIVKQTLEKHPDLSDGLSLLLVVAHNGLGRVLGILKGQIETIQERISIYGNGEGMKKQIAVTYRDLEPEPDAENPFENLMDDQPGEDSDPGEQEDDENENFEEDEG